VSGRKDPLPGSLAKAAIGRFESTLPPIGEARRDFARIFFADERKIFVVAPGMHGMRPVQPTTGPRSAHIGDMSEQVVEKAISLFGERLTTQLEQALGVLDSEVTSKLIERAVASMTVNVGISFAVQMSLMPAFLQPAFLIVILGGSLGQPLQARVATYGFIAERPQQICGDRPESKRTPFCVRLLSPDLLAAEEDSCSGWEVQYNAKEVQTSTITQAVEMDMHKVREAIKTSRWDPLLR